MSSSAQPNRTPYVPPNRQRPARATRSAVVRTGRRQRPRIGAAVCNCWSYLRSVRRRRWIVWLIGLLVGALAIRFVLWWTSDPRAAAQEAWRDVQTRNHAIESDMAGFRCQFGNPATLKTFIDTLNRPEGQIGNTALRYVVKPLRGVTTDGDRLLDQFDELQAAVRLAAKRLDQLAFAHRCSAWWAGPATLNNGYTTLAKQCRKQASSLRKAADRIKIDRKRLASLLRQARAVLLFLDELRPHLDQSFPAAIDAHAYRIQLQTAVGLCLEFHDFFQTDGSRIMSPRNSELAVGIDLGTTYCAINFRSPGNSEKVLLPGVGPQLPSAVFWSDDGSHLVGQPAINAAFKDPARLHTHFKRGVPEQPDAPWDGNGGPSPVDLSIELLRYMWNVLRQVHPEINDYVPDLGGTKPPEHFRMIVTHPATYRQEQVRTLQRIVDGVGDGFPVTGYITEPIAAALVYREQHSLNQGDHLAVIDMGGGTTDICDLRYESGRYEPVDSGRGDAALGGLNFTGAVFEYFCHQLGYAFSCFDPERGLNLSAAGLSPEDRRLASKIWNAAEDVKIQLSTTDSTTVYVETPDGLKDLTLSCQQFVDLCRDAGDLWTRFESCVADIVTASSLRWSDVAGVALVGGSAMIPTLRERVAKITERPVDDVFRSADSTHVVANGAGFQALVQDETGHCIPGGLAVRLREQTHGNGSYRYRAFFKTGEVIPASGTTVEELGQMIDSAGGAGHVQLVLGEAKPGVTMTPGQLLAESEIVRLKTIERVLHVPAGQVDVEIGFQVDPGGRVHWRLGFPGLPDADVLSGLVTDADDQPRTTDVPRDLVLLLDTSASMGGDKLRAAQNAVHNLLVQLSMLDSRVGLVVFGRHVKTVAQLGAPFQDVGSAVESLAAAGGTPMADAIVMGAQHLDAFASQDRERVLLLTTDGHPNNVSETELAATAAKANTTLICVGIGEDVSQQLLLSLATTPQYCFFADAAGDIGDVFGQIFELFFKP